MCRAEKYDVTVGSWELAGKVAIVTGGGRGSAGPRPNSWPRPAPTSRFARARLRKSRPSPTSAPNIQALAGDVADEAFVERLVGQTVAAHGRLDILINNAAVLGRQPFLELEPALWDEVMAVNLRGAYLCCRAAFRQMAGAAAALAAASSTSPR